VLIERPGTVRRKRLTVLNTKAEHDRFVGLLGDLARPVIAGFEATGNYHRPLAHRLLESGFELRLVSSVALARTREALHNGWDKNDPKDAQVILHMLTIGACQRYHDPLAAGINDVQELSKTHEAISRAKTEVLHRILTHYLPLYFPEADRFRQSARSDWFFAFLDAFPTPGSITAFKQAGVHCGRLGTWSAARSRRSACWGISTRRREPRSACPSHWTRRPSECFDSSSLRFAV
jgi:transposase